MSREEWRKAYPERQVLDEARPPEFVDEATVCEKETLTRQSEVDAADINKIVARFEKSGIMPLTNREGAYLDVSEVGDYRQALEQVRKAQMYFEDLPASSRAMFNNDPAEFLDRVNDPNELQLLVDAGVVPKDEVRVRAAAEVAPEGAVKGSGSP